MRSSNSFSRLRCSLIRVCSWFLYFTCMISLAFFLVSSIFFHAYNDRLLSLDMCHNNKECFTNLLLLHFKQCDSVCQQLNIVFCLLSCNSGADKLLGYTVTSFFSLILHLVIFTFLVTLLLVILLLLFMLLLLLILIGSTVNTTFILLMLIGNVWRRIIAWWMITTTIVHL